MTRAEVPTSKTIVCLANSRKLSGRCIAGIEIASSRAVGWIRPVSDRPHGEVSEREREYKDGSDPLLLDVISVPLLRPVPDAYQQENWLLDPLTYWSKRQDPAGWGDLAGLTDEYPLWLEGSSSTYNGLDDRVDFDVAVEFSDSLRLIHVDDLELRVFAPGREFGNAKRRVQASFAYLGAGYRLFVTDPVIEREFLARQDGTYPIGEAYLTISLGEPYDGHVYKLVAAVITEARAARGA